MKVEELASMDSLTADMLNELANLQLPIDFMVGLSVALDGSGCTWLFDSPASFACFRIGYVVAHEMIKRREVTKS